jgi:hypothetical protein
MYFEQQLNYLNKSYKIISAEQEFVVHPSAFCLSPISLMSLQGSFSSNFHIEEYRLILDKLVLNPEVGNIGGNKAESLERPYEFKGCTVSYNGAIIIGTDIVKEYFIKGSRPACFSYQSVFELVFEDGILITTIDHSKKMIRIRKNIELGLRSLVSKRDVRCIKRFIHSSFVGDYKSFLLNSSRLRYLKEMKKYYQDTNFVKQINSIE